MTTRWQRYESVQAFTMATCVIVGLRCSGWFVLAVGAAGGAAGAVQIRTEFADGTNIWIDMQSIGEGRTKLTIRAGVVGVEVGAGKDS